MNTTEQTQQPAFSRDAVIIRTSFIGIGANLLLAAFKAAVGLFSNSIAVVLDAVNNLSDALSSVITILGTKYAEKKPDKKHPLGHGRAEYLSAMIVAALVLYAGITALVESVKNIIHPETPEYSVLSLVIIAAAVVVKLLLGTYVKRTGEKVNSGSLIASGSDALSDAILSASVLLSALIFHFFHISLEAWVGLLISGFIIKAGVQMLLETLDEILGKRVDREFLEGIRETILREKQITGVYDLILHSYGPERYVGSVHVEIPDTMTAPEIDQLERRVAEAVYREHGVVMTGVGIYSVNTQDGVVVQLRQELMRKVLAHDGVLQVHGFYADMEARTVSFDLILDFDLEDRKRTYTEICQEVQQAWPDFRFIINLDIDA